MPPPPPPPPGSPGPRRGSVDGASSAHPPDDPAAPPPSSSSRPPTAPAHEFRVESGSREFVPPTAPGGVRYPLPSGASAVLFDPGSRKLRLPSGGRSRAPSASGAPPRPPAPIGLSNGAPTTPTAGGGAGGAGDTTPPGKAKRNSRRHPKQPLPSWREEWQSVRRWWVRTRESGAKSARERTAFDWAACFLPCLTWLRSYNVKENLMWDVLAGVSVGFMVVPQSMSYANLAGLPPQYGLYAAFVPLAVYAVFGEYCVLVVVLLGGLREGRSLALFLLLRVWERERERCAFWGVDVFFVPESFPLTRPQKPQNQKHPQNKHLLITISQAPAASSASAPSPSRPP